MVSVQPRCPNNHLNLLYERGLSQDNTARHLHRGLVEVKEGPIVFSLCQPATRLLTCKPPE